MLRSRITLKTERELHVNLYILDNVHLIKLEFGLHKTVILQATAVILWII